MEPELVSFLGIFVGVLLRTLLPAVRKAVEDTSGEFKWDHRYTLTAVSAILIAVFVSSMAYPQFSPPEGGGGLVFIQALGFGAGLNSLINEAKSWLSFEPSRSKNGQGGE